MPDKNTTQTWQFKPEKDELIATRDSLQLDLESSNLSSTERLETAQEIDRLNEEIEAD